MGEDETFSLADDRTRSALQWYRERGATNWEASVSGQHAEQLVDAVLKDPPETPPLPSRPANANGRRLTLRKLEAHRFAGLHQFGTPAAPPANYVHDFSAPLTLFEGRNGSGKTSLLNAIIWTLTGEILRPQREPEAANKDFECWVEASGGDGSATSHRLTPVTPMPDVDDYRPDKGWIPADTWVELTFADENGAELPPIRRSQSRSAQGKVHEVDPDLSALGVDPIALRIGTVMPGLLALIRVGGESELGRAVAQLTGLSSLLDLSDHVRRAKQKIDKEFVKTKTDERERIDRAYNTAKTNLSDALEGHIELAPQTPVPAPSDDTSLEQALDKIVEHFEGAKARAFESAKEILGDDFDPGNAARSADLEKNIAPALSELKQLARLPSFARLHGLRQLTSDQLEAAKLKISEILREADTLDALAKDPSTAARSRLYARVATWIADHPSADRNDDLCAVCGGTLQDVVDPVTGKTVKAHLHEAKADAALLSQTLSRWSEAAHGDLVRSLPDALRAELTAELPTHPCDLMKKALVDELFASTPFAGVLTQLKTETANAFDKTVAARLDLDASLEISLPSGCATLAEALKRLDLAIRFASWRQSNDAMAREIVEQVLGRHPKEGEAAERRTLTGKLLDLESTVKGAKPISDALRHCVSLKEELKRRRVVEQRLKDYDIASKALANLLPLGDLADRQVNELRKKLRTEAATWRDRIYAGAFPSKAHKLVDTSTGRKGQLDLIIRAGGVSAPAQHVTNSSALRASLVGFYFAFWEYVLNERGGLKTLLLDDPQELLDDENRQRLADAFAFIVKAGGQLIVTSYDPRFSCHVANVPGVAQIEHRAVYPATKIQPVVRTTLPETEILKCESKFKAHQDDEEAAWKFADSCRVFLESTLADLFDDPAHSSWVKNNPAPTLASFVGRLRPLVRSGPQGMFAAQIFADFVGHPALVDSSAALQLMNKAHHGRRHEIRAGDVAQCADDLALLVRLAGRMHEECRRWQRRDAVPNSLNEAAPPPPLEPMAVPSWNVVICPDLAAFTQRARGGESQDSVEPLDPVILAGKAVFYLRRNNFGFAAPEGSLAIVETLSNTVSDRRLVIARHGEAVYARRFLRSQGTDMIGLTAEIPDPRNRSPKTIILPEAEVVLHQVVGVLFEHSIRVEHGVAEAALVDASKVLERVELAFRVVDESAVPLALANQIVLGGASIELDMLGHNQGALVALMLDDGASIFKRVGAALPGELAHLRQFESIGGLGSSQILSMGKEQAGVPVVMHARVILGVLYRG
jgi:hypothetical protein